MFLGIEAGDWLQAFASFSGAIIAVGGVYWQVNTQSKNDRKNEFDSSINVENYKYYVEFASFCQYSCLQIEEMLRKIKRIDSNTTMDDLKLLMNCFSEDSRIYSEYLEKSKSFATIQAYIDSKNGSNVSEQLDKENLRASNKVLELAKLSGSIMKLAKERKAKESMKLLSDNLKLIISVFESEKSFYSMMSIKVIDTANNLIR